MGSSGEVNAKSIDPAVGGLVWVRRRNGSWWPGKIVGLDELTEDCLVSPRSGTPVKLLGREDASVDWYNLERSTRVKTFRCGEYDDCIEKAKAAATANKKAVKYARREDAILHALELETSRQPNDLEEFCSKMDNPVSDEEDSSYKASLTILNSAQESSDSQDPSTSAHELSQSGISFEESLHETRPKTPNDSEDDGTEGIKRMRGLEDLGLDKKAQVDVIEEAQLDKHIFVSGKENIPSLKRKRSQAAHVYDFLKRKSRRRKISKVLESTRNTLVSVPIMYEQHLRPGASFLHDVSDSQFSILECHGPKRTSSLDPLIVLQSQYNLEENGISGLSGLPEVDSSDALFDVPFVEEDEKYSAGFSHIFASPSEKTKVGAPSRESSQGEQLKNEGLHDLGLTTSSAAYNNINQKMERGTSKWQSKRKRNTRHTNKVIKYGLRNPDNESNGDMTSLECIDGTLGSNLHPKPDTDTDDTPNEHLRMSKNLSNREPDSKNLLDSSRFRQRSIPYQQSRFSVEAEYQKEELYDVLLEVKSIYRPQHVPLVSLMSKVNGKAIIGHPLTVDAMVDGTSDQIVKGSWPALENGELGYSVKSNTTARSSLKPKKAGLLLKKTRRLSALTSCQKLKEAKRNPIVEKINGQAAIACIPLKVVFSRLNEAVSGSSRSSHRALTSS